MPLAISVPDNRRTVPTAAQSIGSDTLSRAINDAREDKTIKAIVIRVDSPGGSGLASDIIWHAVVAAKERSRW